jgi:hypothetical protein
MPMNGQVLNKYSVGTGDRFAHQAKAQLQACILASHHGVVIVPVWNKSNREHTIIGSDPAETRAAADAAVKALHWDKPYFCDADHITLQTVDRFLAPCDFYTIDVADDIGKPASAADTEDFVKRHVDLLGTVRLEGVDETFEVTQDLLRNTAGKFLSAVKRPARFTARSSR